MGEAGRFESRKDPYLVIAHYYDAEHEHISDDVAFYRDMAAMTGPHVLDLGCGTGRVGLALAREGMFVVGVDSSDTMLAVANGKLRRDRVPFELRRADMRSLDYTSQFDLVVCALDTFGHLLTIEDQLACLGGVRKALKPGGLFAVDVLNPNPDNLAVRNGAVILRSEFEPTRATPSKHFVIWSINYESQLITAQHMYDSVSPDGVVKRREAGYELRYFFRYEMELLLRTAGLKVQSVYSDYARSAYSFGADRMVFVAARVD